MLPAAMYSWAARQVGSAIDCTPTVTTLFVLLRRIDDRDRLGDRLGHRLFQYTSLPASMASMAMRACQWSGVAMHTTSTSFWSRIVR